MRDEELAEEYATKECCTTCKNINHFCKEKCECWTFAKKGVEFGYKKGFEECAKAKLNVTTISDCPIKDEWHYPSKGEYPKDDKKVLCILGDFENDNLKVGYYSQDEGDSKRWQFEDYDLPDDSENGWGVSAWKEIVLPELPKER